MHRHRRDPLFASKYQRDSHQRIVNGVSEVVSGKSRGLIATLQQDDIVHIVLLFDSTADQINELDALRGTVGRTKANRVWLSGRETAHDFSLRKISATRPRTVIAGLDLCRKLFFRHLGQLFPSTKTWIGMAVPQQLSRVGVIDKLSL